MQVGDDTDMSVGLVVSPDFRKTHIDIESRIKMKEFPYGRIWRDSDLTKCAYEAHVATKGELLK